MQLIGPTVASFALCLLATFALRPFAVALDLIDRPGGHKTHHGEIPVVGGIAMMLGVVVGFGLLPLGIEHPASGNFLAGCAILVTVGLMDDRFNLSPWARLPVHAAAALLLIFGTGTVVTTLGYPFGGGEVLMSGWPSVVFTMLAIMLAINAFNMLDGMDGLAGAMALVALTALAFIALLAGAVVPAAISLVIAAAVVGFLISNVPLRFNRDVRCFMGDSGSTLLGFAVAWVCILVSQPAVETLSLPMASMHFTAISSPVTMLWLAALPLFDILWSVTRRLLRRRSPLKPDHEHLHHLLLRAGFGVRGAFLILVVLASALAAFGVVLQHMRASDAWSFGLLIIAGVLVVRLMYRAHVLLPWLPQSLQRLPAAPSAPVASAQQ